MHIAIQLLSFGMFVRKGTIQSLKDYTSQPQLSQLKNCYEILAFLPAFQ